MKPISLAFLLFGLGVASYAAPAGVRIIFGLTDESETSWDGSVTGRGARVTSIQPWRFEGTDAVNGTSWKASTHRIRLFGGGVKSPFVANGVIVWLADASDSGQLDIQTAQGNFTVRLGEIPFGTMGRRLGGRVMVDRIPPVERITESPDEQDYPSAATGKTGELWLAYFEFRHNKDHNRIRANFTKPPKDFKELTAPTGGDQILLRKFSNGKWGESIAITGPGGDLYRPAVAIDGAGRPWVFWSAQESGNFDLWARLVENGKPGRTVRLSRDPGSDIDPAATTDAKGRVWVAWQGWRDGRAAIFATVQQGEAFSAPVMVSTSVSDEWNPAIAADSAGSVTVAWDSYRNGNYDVYLRTATAESSWGAETPVAATARYEAYPSISYDPSGRLWVAYEEGGERWGKDWGAYETTGLALYQGRAVRLVGFHPRQGQVLKTRTDIGAVLPGEPAQRVDNDSRQSQLAEWLTPSPVAAKERQPSRIPAVRPYPKNSLPRLHVDASGRIWVAFRSAHPIWWNPVGTVWSEYLVSYDGAAWTGPVFLASSDNLLDNRPAVVSTGKGEVMVIGSADGRRSFRQVEMAGGVRAADRDIANDPFQNDLYVSRLTLPPARGEIPVTAGSTPVIAARDPADQAESGMADTLRRYRMNAGGVTYRIVRGEFHRHSEISMDGGNDGTILDQWRYMHDPAAMDWAGCCDHDNGGGREYSWWITQKETDIFHHPGKFVPMFSYERSVSYPEGHRNTVFAQRGVRPLPRLPKTADTSAGHAPDTLMFYRYLRKFNGIVASHTSATNMGTDWRDNNPLVEPVVEIYQGDRQNYEMPDAPRSNSEKDSIGGWRPKGFVNLALEMGYKLGFQASSDHISTHMSYCNILATDLTREALLDAFRKRHVYGATDDILADVRSGDHLMGDAFSTSSPPALEVKLAGQRPFAKVHIIKDNKYVYTTDPKKAEVEFTWRDNSPTAGKTSYYYVRGEQEDGEIVWVSPMWITYKGR